MLPLIIAAAGAYLIGSSKVSKFVDGGTVNGKYKIFTKIENEGGNGADYINFYIGNNKIGYVEYAYDGSSFSIGLPLNAKEFYMASIEVYKDYRGKNYSEPMIDYVKKYAESLGATIITLRVDYGMGGGNERNPDYGLEKIYLKNGFKYTWGKDEYDKDEEKNLLAMHYTISGNFENGGMMAQGNWIADAVKHKGALRKTAKREHLIKGDEKLSMTDLKKLEKKGGVTKKRAILAETLRKINK